MNNFCQECGSPRSENAKFCANCGFKFYQEAKEEVKSDSEVELQKEIENQEYKEIAQVEEPLSQESKKIPQNPKIGGWLYLVAIGLIISPLFDIGSALNFLDTSAWQEAGLGYELDQLNKFNIKIVWGSLFASTTIILFLLFINFYAIFSFFTKSKNTRFLMLLFYGISFCFYATLFAFGIIQKDYSLIQDSRAIISSTIWFFYFLVSQRVKDTFVLDYSKKQKWLRIGLSSVVPLIIFVVFLFKSIFYFQNLEETRKRDVANLTKLREIFENPRNLLEEFTKRRDEVVKKEVQAFSLTYSFRGANLSTESEILNYVYNNPKYTNLFQGIIYFCGLECSSIPQDLSKAYYYFNNLPYTQKEAMSMILAEMDLYGIGTQQNLASAVKNANNASDLGKEIQGIQYYYLALGYLYGAYFKKDIDTAITYFRKSANLDHPSSALLVALFMATEPKGKYNKQTIIHYFEKAILLNNSTAELWLAYYYYNNNESNMAKNTLLNCSKTNSECKTAYQELFE